MLLNHREEADRLFFFAVSIHHGFLDQRFQPRLAEERKIGFRLRVSACDIHMNHRACLFRSSCSSIASKVSLSVRFSTR